MAISNSLTLEVRRFQLPWCSAVKSAVDCRRVEIDEEEELRADVCYIVLDFAKPTPHLTSLKKMKGFSLDTDPFRRGVFATNPLKNRRNLMAGQVWSAPFFIKKKKNVFIANPQ